MSTYFASNQFAGDFRDFRNDIKEILKTMKRLVAEFEKFNSGTSFREMRTR